MRYNETKPTAKVDAERIFASNDIQWICETLVSLALNESDWRWTQDKCVEFTYHPEWQVRAIAATSIGHLARLHGQLDLGKIESRLSELMQDFRTAGYAENAMSDIKMFMSSTAR